jgi:hypothetical protein
MLASRIYVPASGVIMDVGVLRKRISAFGSVTLILLSSTKEPAVSTYFQTQLVISCGIKPALSSGQYIEDFFDKNPSCICQSPPIAHLPSDE